MKKWDFALPCNINNLDDIKNGQVDLTEASLHVMGCYGEASDDWIRLGFRCVRCFVIQFKWKTHGFKWCNLSTSIDPNQEGEKASHFVYVLTSVTIKSPTTIARWKYSLNFSENHLALPAIVQGTYCISSDSRIFIIELFGQVWIFCFLWNFS